MQIVAYILQQNFAQINRKALPQAIYHVKSYVYVYVYLLGGTVRMTAVLIGVCRKVWQG